MKEVGEDASNNFILFVANFDCLAATTFLNEFYSWFSEGCSRTTCGDHGSNSDIDLGPDDDMRDIMGLATIGSKMMSSGRDDTNQIRYDFMRDHSDFLKGHKDLIRKDFIMYDGYMMKCMY